jgi:hypothetical protein
MTGAAIGTGAVGGVRACGATGADGGIDAGSTAGAGASGAGAVAMAGGASGAGAGVDSAEPKPSFFLRKLNMEGVEWDSRAELSMP